MREYGEAKEEIIQFIKKYADKDGLPLFNEPQWIELNNRFTSLEEVLDPDGTKRTIVNNRDVRSSLVKYIVEEKIPFPFRKIDKEQVIDSFFKLCQEPLNVSYPDAVSSKFVYNRPYNGVVFDGKPKFNIISDFFHMENRYRCDTKHNVSILESWETGRALFSVLVGFWTMKYTEMSRTTWNSVLTVSVQVASQFRPAIVKNIINYFDREHGGVKTYMDMSCGWGDRLAGFYASNAERYIGFDPSTKSFPLYLQQKQFYDKLINGSAKIVDLYNLPAEDVNYDQLPEIDLFFSSPPYFMAERYENNPTQSWVRYKTIEDWKQKFLFNVLEKSWGKIKEGGHMLINISDITTEDRKQRVHICDDMCQFLEKMPRCNFLGYYGMKLHRRANADTVQTHLDKEELNKRACSNQKSVFVEPIWVFRKGDSKSKNINVDDLFE